MQRDSSHHRWNECQTTHNRAVYLYRERAPATSSFFPNILAVFAHLEIDPLLGAAIDHATPPRARSRSALRSTSKLRFVVQPSQQRSVHLLAVLHRAVFSKAHNKATNHHACVCHARQRCVRCKRRRADGAQLRASAAVVVPRPRPLVELLCQQRRCELPTQLHCKMDNDANRRTKGRLRTALARALTCLHCS